MCSLLVASSIPYGQNATAYKIYHFHQSTMMERVMPVINHYHEKGQINICLNLKAVFFSARKAVEEIWFLLVVIKLSFMVRTWQIKKKTIGGTFKICTMIKHKQPQKQLRIKQKRNMYFRWQYKHNQTSTFKKRH